MKQFALILAFSLVHFLGFSQVIRLQENFNSSSLPVGWTNSAVTGAQSWSFGIDGSSSNAGNNNLDGTTLAFFDDDSFGAASLNNTVSLTSPVFDNSNDISSTLEFDYNFREFVGPTDSFYVEVYDGTNWITVFSTTSNDCGNWLAVACLGNFPHANIDISAFKNANCQVRFNYHDGNDWCWYVGIDNVSVTSIVRNDIGVHKFNVSANNCGLSTSEIITVQLNNFGSDSVKMPFGITLNVDNGQQVITETVTAGIPPNDSLLHSFINTVNLAAVRSYNLQAYTNYAIDNSRTNDSLSVVISNNNTVQLPYFEDFENYHAWSLGGQHSSWEKGIPNSAVVKFRYNNDSSLVTNLNGSYNSNENSFAESPCFDLSSNQIPIISFDMNYHLEMNFDKVLFESSTDGGFTWQTIFKDSIATNWYDSSGYWTGNSNGWKHFENRLPHLIGQNGVKFRCNLVSDQGTNLDGLAFDNFTIRYNSLHDVQLVEVLSPNTTGLCSNGNENIIVKLKNKGSLPLDSFFVSYQVNSGIPLTDTLTQLILPEQEVEYNFSSRFNFLNGIANELNVWVKNTNDTYSKNDSIANFIVDTSNFNSSPTAYSLPYLQNFNSPAWTQVSPVSVTTIGPDWVRSPSSWQVHTTSLLNCFNPDGSPAYDPQGNISKYLRARSNPNGAVSLTTPCIALANSENVTLGLNYFSIDTLQNELLIEINDGARWRLLDTIESKSQNSCSSIWDTVEINLAQYRDRLVKFRMTLLSNTSSQWAYSSIDDFKVFDKFNVDARLNSIDGPLSSCRPDSVVSVAVENYGSQPISNIPISFQINGGQIITENISTVLLPGAKTNFSFNQTFNSSLPNTTYTIKTWLSLVGDQDFKNDTLSLSMRNEMRISNYFEDFESFKDGNCTVYNLFDSIGDWDALINYSYAWNLHDNSLCGLGTYTINTGPHYDHTKGNGTGKYIYSEAPFGPGPNAILISPCIDFRQDSSAELSFWYHKYGSGMNDLIIDVFSNGTWSQGIDSIIGQTHFNYTDPWLQKVINLNSFAGQIIKIRFRASATITNTTDMAIDDVHFYNPLTVGSKVLQGQSQIITLYPNPNNGNFNLNVSNALVGKHYQIFDVKGGLMKQGRINTTNSQLELSNADKGIYFMRIEGMAKAERIVVL